MTDKAQHVFEKAGLGKAPYRYLGITTTSDRAALNAEAKANGEMYTTNYCTCCDYCYTAINDAYRLESADGKRFKVGCECIKKAGDKGLEKQIDKDRKRVAREKRHAREAKQLAEAEAWCRENSKRLSEIPSTNEHGRKRDESLLDQLRWYWKHAGTSGKLRMYRHAKSLLGGEK